VLLKAGADIRSALSIIGAKAGRASLKEACRKLAADIGGGGAVEQAFASTLPSKHAFVSALVAAGEAAGDLAGGCWRASEVLRSKLRLQEQIVSVAAYPAFVLASTVAALIVILFFVVPSLAPLAEMGGAEPPLALKIMIGTSDFLRSNLAPLLSLLAVAIGATILAGRAGVLRGPVEQFLLDGPLSRVTRPLIFGGFAIGLGSMLSGGTRISDALRLSTRSVKWAEARTRLEPVAARVRQGEPLSNVLESVKGFPLTIIRLTAVGEHSSSIGAMLLQAGRIEEEAAIRQIETISRVLGPALIVLLGGVVGLLMLGLLTGVSQLGQSALQ